MEKIEDFIKKIVQCSHNTIMTQAQLQSRALRLLFSLSLPLVKIILTLIKFYWELDSSVTSRILNFLLVRQTDCWLAGRADAGAVSVSVLDQTTEPTTFGLLGAICHSEKLLVLSIGRCQLWALCLSDLILLNTRPVLELKGARLVLMSSSSSL